MAGSVRGTAALIQRNYPMAVYIHCASHCLNLAVVKSLSVTSVRNMMGIVGRIYQFFAAHPKRQRALEQAISDRHPTSASHKLKDMCRTRWVQRIDAADTFQCLLTSVVDCLENVCDDGSSLWSRDSLADARSLQLAITTPEFVSALVITNACLKYIQALTTSLQAEAKDIVAAMREVDNVIEAVNNVRNNIDTYHAEWFLTVCKLLEEVGREPSIPRRCGRQAHRTNIPATTPVEYFRRTITVPVLDHLLSELRSRFSKHQKTALLGLCVVPSLVVSLPSDESTSLIKELRDMYKEDLPSHECTETELQSWKIKWQKQATDHGENSLPSSLILTLAHLSSMYPNLSALVKILCTLPVTSCSAKRSFSGLKHVKTSFRTTMTNAKLIGLTLVHRNIKIDIDAAIDCFARKCPRRMRMIKILDEEPYLQASYLLAS